MKKGKKGMDKKDGDDKKAMKSASKKKAPKKGK